MTRKLLLLAIDLEVLLRVAASAANSTVPATSTSRMWYLPERDIMAGRIQRYPLTTAHEFFQKRKSRG